MDITRIFSVRSQFTNQDEIILRDYLAMERTKLANERTLLAYIRSSLYLLLGGIGLLQLKDFENIHFLGYVSLSLTVTFLLVGIYRYHRLRKRLDDYYQQIDLLAKKVKPAP